jgi:hypothetical protein
MIDAEDLACRYLHLWQDYLIALMADLREPGLLQLWIAACSALAGNPAPRDPAAVEGTRLSGPPAGAAPATGASRQRDDVLADLASRVARVEDRLAALRTSRAGSCTTSRPRSTPSELNHSKGRSRPRLRIAPSATWLDLKPVAAIASAAIVAQSR